MKPYLEINEEECQTLKDMYPKDELKEKLYRFMYDISTTISNRKILRGRL